MQRAGHAIAMHHALGERAALVRAAILQRKDPVVEGAEHRDAALRGPDHTGTLHGHVLKRADIDKSTHSAASSVRSARGAHLGVSAGVESSAQGSRR